MQSLRYKYTGRDPAFIGKIRSERVSQKKYIWLYPFPDRIAVNAI